MRETTIIIRQEPLVLLDYTDTLAASSSLVKEVPCVGLSFLCGLIYTSKAITLTISEGVSSPATNYRYTQTWTIAAGDTQAIECALHGKYIKATLTNASLTDDAAIEAFLSLRGIE